MARTHVTEQTSPRDIASRNFCQVVLLVYPWTMVQHGLGYSIATMTQRVHMPLNRGRALFSGRANVTILTFVVHWFYKNSRNTPAHYPKT